MPGTHDSMPGTHDSSQTDAKQQVGVASSEMDAGSQPQDEKSIETRQRRRSWPHWFGGKRGQEIGLADGRPVGLSMKKELRKFPYFRFEADQKPRNTYRGRYQLSKGASRGQGKRGLRGFPYASRFQMDGKHQLDNSFSKVRSMDQAIDDKKDNGPWPRFRGDEQSWVRGGKKDTGPWPRFRGDEHIGNKPTGRFYVVNKKETGEDIPWHKDENMADETKADNIPWHDFHMGRPYEYDVHDSQGRPRVVHDFQGKPWVVQDSKNELEERETDKELPWRKFGKFQL